MLECENCPRIFSLLRPKNCTLRFSCGDDTAHWRGLGIVLVLLCVDRPILEAHSVFLEDHYVRRTAELEVTNLGVAGDTYGFRALFDDESAWLDHTRRHLDHPDTDERDIAA